MHKHLIRLSLAIGLAMFGASMAPSAAAVAATGPWTWTDVSSQISVRSNRPVWAVAHAGTNWYFTDGQDLSTTGHVWKTDGKNSTDITTSVRNAGLSRVDAMISDENAVLFLKNPTVPGQAEVLGMDNSGFFNLTKDFRAILNNGEGIRSLYGSKGKMGFVTTENVAVYAFELPPKIKLVRGSPLDGLNGVLKYDNHEYFQTVASGGTDFRYLMLFNSPKNGVRLVSSDEGKMESINLPSSVQSLDWAKAQMAWTGKSWMILVGKDLFRLNGNQLESYGQTRDYFVSIASDGNGTVYLAGAVSNATTHNGPTNPLTAKLVNVYEGGSVTEAVADTSSWTWVEPGATEIHRDQTMTYNVGGWSANGVKRIDVFVNWNLVKSCTFQNTSGNQTCQATLSGSAYQPNTSVSIISKITNGSDKASWTPFTVLAVKDSPFAVTTNTNTNSTTNVVNGVSVWSWFQPNVATLDYRDSATFVANANATNGLNRVDISVNGTSKLPCDFARAMGTQECSYTLNGIDFPVGTQLTVTAAAKDNSGSTATQSHTLTITDNFANAGQHPSVISTWMSPTLDNVPSGQTVQFYANAQDTDGLSQIVIVANGKTVQTCSFTNAYDTRECSTPVSNQVFAGDSNVTLLAKTIDANGSVTLANARSFYIAK